MIKNKNPNYLKVTLIKNIKNIVEEKRGRLDSHQLYFDKEIIDELDGAVRLGYYIQFKNYKTGIINFEYWEDVSAITLVKIKDKLLKNEFYGKKWIKDSNCKVRLKS